MAVGIGLLAKKKKKESSFEKLIARGDLELAGDYLIKLGYRKFGNAVASLEDTLPYISTNSEEKMKVHIIRLYKDISKRPVEKEEDTIAFKNLENAMKFFKLKKGYLDEYPEDSAELDDYVREEKEKGDKEKRSLEKRTNKEKDMLEPTIGFVPLVEPKRIGLVYADIIVIGKTQNLRDALNEFPYTTQNFSHNEMIIRKVLLLGISSSSFYVFHKRGDPVFKKPKKGSWKEALEKKRSGPKFTDKDLAFVVSKNKRLKDYRIVSQYYVRHDGYVYMLLLPPTVISLPYCKMVKGRIIPLIDSWTILGIE